MLRGDERGGAFSCRRDRRGVWVYLKVRSTRAQEVIELNSKPYNSMKRHTDIKKARARVYRYTSKIGPARKKP